MSDQASVIVNTALQTAEALAPAVLSAGAVSSPQGAAVVALAPVALQLLQSATQLSNAGVMSPDQLASLFASIGKNIEATHTQWAAMNEAAK